MEKTAYSNKENLQNAQITQPKAFRIKKKSGVKRSTLEKESILEVVPPQIVFHNVEAKKTYEVKFAIRNKSVRKHRVKLTQPKQDCFSVEVDESADLAPGLSIIARVIFRSGSQEELFDQFKVFSENCAVEVQISVFPPSAFFVFKPFVDFGFVEIEQQAMKTFVVRNEGLKEGELVFDTKDCPYEITPASVAIQPGQSQTIEINLCASQTGVIRRLISLKLKGHSIYKAIDVSANVIQSSQFLLNENGQEIQRIDFGRILVNQKKVENVLIVNNSPQPVSFTINVIKGFHNASPQQTQLQTPFDKGRELTERVLVVKPAHGQIPPYGNFSLKFQFKVSHSPKDLIIVRQHALREDSPEPQPRESEYTAIFEFSGRTQQRYLQVSAFCELPRVYFQTTSFDFDQLFQKDERQLELILVNKTENQSVLVKSPQEFFLHVDIKEFYLKPLEEKKVVLKFRSSQIGLTSKSLFFIINKCFKIPIKIFAYVNASSNRKKLKSKIDIEKLKQKHFYLNKIQKLQLPKRFKQTEQEEQLALAIKKFEPDPTLQIKEFSAKPIKPEDQRSVCTKLSGYQLMAIAVGPVHLNFGSVFVKSTASLWFQIKNTLKQPVLAVMQTNNIQELALSYLKAQVVPGEKVAGFKVTFRSNKPQKFSEKISYCLNGHHFFNILITAEAVPVRLDVDRENIIFKFEEDSLAMINEENLIIRNPGNATAFFRLRTTEPSAFTFNEARYELQPGESIPLKITYLPLTSRDEASFSLEVENGKPITIKCQGICNEAHCELTPKSLQLGTLAVGQKKTATFKLLNKNNKYYAIFKVDEESLPKGVTIKPLTGKVVPDDKQDFEITYFDDAASELNSHEIYVLVRGSKRLKIVLSVQTILPVIDIQQQEFDFGSVTFGTKGTLPLTITNKSEIPAEVLVNLNSTNPVLQEKLECLEFSQQEDTLDQSQIIERIKTHKDQSLQQAPLCYIFHLKPKRSYTVLLNFSPQKPSPYEFELPFYLPSKNNQLLCQRKIRCLGSNPRFLMEPLHGVIQFPRKVILSAEQVVPEYQSLTISNPNFEDPLIWHFDVEALRNQKVFSISPTQGVIEPQCTISLDVGFQPFRAQAYKLDLSLTFKGESELCTQVSLRGEGAYPKLLFDCEEVVMDIVPLGQRSRYILTVVNDGYNNQTLTARLPQEHSELPLEVRFVSGSTIGINNPELEVELSFETTVPISFTTKLCLEDDQKRAFFIYVSGTSDNSLFSNYQFFGEGGWQIGNEGKLVQIEEEDEEGSRVISEEGIGFEDETKAIVFQKQVANAVVSWLREYGIANIERYPEDAITLDGGPIYDALSFLVKNAPSKPSISQTIKKNERIELLLTAHLKLLTFLKDHNAMLNTVRPQHLFSYEDLNLYLSNTPNAPLSHLARSLSRSQHTMISLRAWNLLFTQIMKIFYLARVTPKTFKQSLSALTLKPPQIPPLESSKIYSNSEQLLLKWLETLLVTSLGSQKVFTSFDKDLQDSLAIVAAVENYVQLDIQILTKLRRTSTRTEDISYNFQQAKKLLFEYGIKEDLKESDFLNPNPVSFLLLTVHLFKTLPNFLPRAKVEFSCALHESVTKEVSFSNPASKTIIYAVRLFGHSNFHVDQDILKLDPKQTVSFPLHYYANTSLPAEGKIIFQNRKNGNSVAGAIVFDLVARVSSRFSMKTLTIKNMNLYELGTTEIVVNNPFDKDADFQIEIQNVLVEDTERAKPAQKTRGSRKSKKKSKEDNHPPLPSFFLKQQRIWIYKNSSAKIYLMYLPMTYQTHKCNLVFLDPKVGEMQYEVLGVPRIPQTQQSFKFTKNIEDFTSLEVPIPSKNVLFENAALKLIEKLRETNQKHLIPRVESLQAQLNQPYSVELVPGGYFHHSHTFTVTTPQVLLTDTPPKSNLLILTPSQKQPVKDLQFKLIMKDALKANIRMYNLSLTVLPKVIQATLEMHTTARVPIIQDIPVSNPTEVDCVIKPSFLSLENGEKFELSLNPFTVKKRTVGAYTVKFASDWVSRAQGKLNLLNQLTNDNFEYLLKAEAEEPLSEDHIKCKTKAKHPTQLCFEVKNPMNKSDIFSVHSDLPNSICPKSLDLAAGESCQFEINFEQKLGGQFMHAVTFTNQQGHYFWYLFSLEVDPPEADASLEIFTEIRKPALLKIPVKNETDHDIEYRVLIQGKSLQGEATLYVTSNSTAEYELIYYPFKIEKKQSKLGFLNEQEGELWFDISLQAVEAKPKRLPILTAELGKFKEQTVTLKNPLKGNEILVECEIPKDSNFSVAQKSFILLAKEKKEVAIKYMPRMIGKKETEMIVFKSKELGNWKFMVFGVGVPPTDFDKIQINSIIQKSAQQMISFKNPFNTDISVQVVLESDFPEVFQMQQSKSKNIIIQADQTLQFSVKFIPKIIKTYQAKIYIKLNKKIFWCYPIEGITESISNTKEIALSCVCGKEIEKQFNYQIFGLEEIDAQEEFEHQLVIKHQQKSNIENWFKIKTIKNTIQENGDFISYIFSFLPLKPFKTHLDLIVSRKSGGRWRIKVFLEAQVPDYFETITIISQLNVKKNIQFKLFNNDKKLSSNFMAYFTQDSDTEFSVYPQKGVLQPEIKDGTLIQISYLPVEYGKLKVGKLIVETDNCMWRFLVKGAFKKYLPPNKKKTKTIQKSQKSQFSFTQNKFNEYKILIINIFIN